MRSQLADPCPSRHLYLYDSTTPGRQDHTLIVGLERSWICARLSERFCQGEVVASAGPAEYTVTFCLSARTLVPAAGFSLRFDPSVQQFLPGFFTQTF